MTEFTVQHNPEQQCFIVEADSEFARLDYLLNADTIDFTHTFVPPAFRGKGVAEKLVRTGLAWAKKQGYTIHASCWYVQKFLG